MALSLSPFGLRPYHGRNFKTKLVKMADTHTVVGPGTVLVGADLGAVPLADDIVANQTKIIGVSLDYIVANAGNYCLCADPFETEFLVQSASAYSTYTGGEQGVVQNSIPLLCTGSYAGVDTTTYKSKMVCTATGSHADAPLIIQRLAPIAGNDTTATSYPIWVVRFNLPDLFGFAGSTAIA